MYRIDISIETIDSFPIYISQNFKQEFEKFFGGK